MIRSMTGFARARRDNESYSVQVEMRSVNYRYLDVRVRVPNAVAPLELGVRDKVASRLGRGKVDVSLRLEPKQESAYELEVDRPLIEQILRVSRRLASELGLDGELTLSDLLGFGRGFNVKEKDLGEGTRVLEAVEPAVEEALEELVRMREVEGAKLEADLKERLEAVAKEIDAIERVSEASREKRKQELLDKVRELESSALEPNALAMEVTRLVERSDITEEITRFRSHLAMWRQTVGSEGPCGKKLDFITQEMNREINTMGSKCQDAETAAKVIAAKSELERMREQVQNIE